MIPGQGIKILQATWHGKKKKKDIKNQYGINRDRKYNRGYQELGEGGMESYCLMGTEFVWDDEVVLEMDSGNGCTTL